ncbi:TetR/AcrR family transcriptional regulator [Actinomadura parmotrematis]|uniref:TetR/AcrR family transcriptional regulator n=1 Tax=Actinomadura parmotrematis TaxID=2864039 RepID=A0ABS7FZJ7_9ACTN|nr:TetR/AcrR family transcriptional regulator [Actinomadura parmotrematis]MBW8485370.1 TetR/AcrR family transcriptional regulator [Actinomadura parmotrematis]
MESTAGPPLSGRRAQAARNDELIREAARAVFTADPGAPIAAVAERAGVGISALYRRYGSKEGLLQHLADDGMDRYLAQVEGALAATEGAGAAALRDALAAFLHRCLDLGAGAITMRLAGEFPVTAEMSAKGRRIHAATRELLDRAKAAGVLRPDVEVGDVSVILEYLHTVRIGDDERMGVLQHRYLALMLDGLARTGAGPLPGPAPDWQELRDRYDG